MWVRKSYSELAAERKIRMKNYEVFVICFSFLAVMFIYWSVGSIDGLLKLIHKDPEYIFVVLMLPLLVYFGYRSYVLHGKFGLTMRTDTTGKVCLSCGIGLGYGDDSWRFKSYGKAPKKWYQIKKCKTPEKCDIAYMHEVKLIQDDLNIDTDVNDQGETNRKHKFSIDRKDIEAILIVLLIAISIVALPFMIGWLFYFLF